MVAGTSSSEFSTDLVEGTRSRGTSISIRGRKKLNQWVWPEFQYRDIFILGRFYEDAGMEGEWSRVRVKASRYNFRKEPEVGLSWHVIYVIIPVIKERYKLGFVGAKEARTGYCFSIGTY